ncbi:MAG: IMPACT family protein [Bacteroidales bacterium]|jgi:uncharacterized YigZ family protein|nr:IMPACT family protein [Bacteroidales bacterium]
MEDSYKTIEMPSEGIFKDKGSKFYAFAWPVISEEEIKKIITSLKKEHHSARHHCYAWKLGVDDTRFRTNDDGEPSSTAGRPILGQLQSFNVTNTLVVVVRYFGGTLLGTSGLINAYKTAAAEALKNANIITKNIEQQLIINFGYNILNEVMDIIKQKTLNVIKTSFGENCSIILSVRNSEVQKITETFNKIYSIKIEPV